MCFWCIQSQSSWKYQPGTMGYRILQTWDEFRLVSFWVCVWGEGGGKGVSMTFYFHIAVTHGRLYHVYPLCLSILPLWPKLLLLVFPRGIHILPCNIKWLNWPNQQSATLVPHSLHCILGHWNIDNPKKTVCAQAHHVLALMFLC